MKAPVDPIERFAARLADGEPIDWQEAEQFLPPEALQQLRELAELTRVMRTAGGSTVDVVRELDHWGHLKIQDCLGSGQFGEVFRAFDPILRRDVSLKLSRGNIEVDPASWIEEARQLARVRHPHVLAVHGADIHDGEPGLWADLIMGQTLTDHRREHSPSTEKRLSLMLQLARALRAVHRQGLAHGDVKPANVMIEPNDRAILMDFGSARDLNAKVDATRATGTPLYMAPERLAGNRASPAADVFALGGVFVFLLTGRPPFPASSVEQLISLHKSRSLVSLKGMACSRAERRLIQAMLNPNTEQRPDIDEVIGDLERIQTAPGRRRRALAVGTIIILLAAGLTAATIGFVNVRQAERETTAMNELLREVLVAPRGTELGREARVVDVLDRALFQAERRFGNQPEILARVQYLVGDTLQSLTQHDEAKPLLEQAYEEYLQRYGPTDARTLDLLNAIAEVEKDLGNPDRAEALWQKILEGSDTATTAGRVQSLLAHARLANLSMERNELDAALDRLALASELHQDEATDQVMMIARMLESLIMIRAGRFFEAEGVATDVLSETLRLQGPRNINTIVSRERLVEVKANLNRLDEAERLARENLAVTLDWLGRDDPHTVSAQATLSILLAERGQVEESLALLDDAIEGAEQAFPPEAPNALVLKVNRAARYLELGRTERAIELGEAVAEQLANSPAPVGQISWLNSLNLAEAYYQIGQFDVSSERAGAMRLEIQAAVGDAHPLTQIAASYEGAALSRLGRFDEAAALLDPAVDHLSATLGESDAQTLMALGWQALNLDGLGQAGDARAQMTSTLASARAELGDDHYRVRDLERLASRLLPAETPRIEAPIRIDR